MEPSRVVKGTSDHSFIAIRLTLQVGNVGNMGVMSCLSQGRLCSLSTIKLVIITIIIATVIKMSFYFHHLHLRYCHFDYL